MYDLIFTTEDNNNVLLMRLTPYVGNNEEWCMNKASVEGNEYSYKSYGDYGDVCLLDGEESYYQIFLPIDVDLFANFETGKILDTEIYKKIIDSFGTI